MTAPARDPLTTALMQARQAQGLTLLEVGLRCGRKTAQSVWQWENVTRSPSLVNVHQWARALGFDLALIPRPDGDTCEAKPRGSVNPKGWTCTGRDLVVLLRTHVDDHDVPVVVRSDLLPEVMTQPWSQAYGEPAPFAGGDHLHLVILPKPEVAS